MAINSVRHGTLLQRPLYLARVEDSPSGLLYSFWLGCPVQMLLLAKLHRLQMKNNTHEECETIGGR
jgi:hypothetical protein